MASTAALQNLGVSNGPSEAATKPNILDDAEAPSLMSVCAACGSSVLAQHLKVAGAAGPEGLIPSTSRFGTALADIVRCQTCGHMQIEPMPSEPHLAKAYTEASSEAYIGEETGQRATARRALERIEKQAAGPGKLLDLGCWVGFLMAEARDRGWRTLGVEPSQFASSYARNRLGLDVITGELLKTPLQANAFDAVVMGDVIEHLPAPAQALAHVRGRLRVGGVLWLALPDAGSRVARVMGRRWWSVIPTHVQYFSRGSMAVMLHRCGFEILELGPRPRHSPSATTWNEPPAIRRRLCRLLVRGAQAGGMAGRLWAPDFRDRMFVIARPR